MNLAEPGHALGHFLRIEQEHHGRPLYGAVPVLIDQVNDDRKQSEWQSDKQNGLQKTHLALRAVFGFLPMRKRARACS